MPLDWAATQNNLGHGAFKGSASGRAERRGSRQAVEAYRAALEEFNRERVPLEWATTQIDLGIALEMLGERESGTARLGGGG